MAGKARKNVCKDCGSRLTKVTEFGYSRYYCKKCYDDYVRENKSGED